MKPAPARFMRGGDTRSRDDGGRSSATLEADDLVELLFEDAWTSAGASLGRQAEQALISGAQVMLAEASTQHGADTGEGDVPVLTSVARLGYALRDAEARQLAAANDHDHAGWFTLLQAVEGYRHAREARGDDWLIRCCHGLVGAGNGLWAGFATLIPGPSADVRNTLLDRCVAVTRPRLPEGRIDPTLLVAMARYGFLYRCATEMLSHGGDLHRPTGLGAPRAAP